MTDTNSHRPLAGMTTGEAEAWRAGWRAARALVASLKFTEYRIDGAPSPMGLFVARNTIETTLRALGEEPPA